MNIGILGSGMVARSIGGKLAERGHTVVLGSRDPAALMARTEGDAMGNPPFAVWKGQHPAIGVGTFAEAAAYGELLFNCTNGSGSIAALGTCDAASLNAKVLVDISNPLDFSRGFPPSLFVANIDSLAEQIQRAFPSMRVVKSLNTVNALVMVNPAMIPGEHVMFVAGDDPAARVQVANLLMNEFGWISVIDLGGIKAARTMEAYVLLWVNLMGALGTPFFNLSIVKAG